MYWGILYAVILNLLSIVVLRDDRDTFYRFTNFFVPWNGPGALRRGGRVHSAENSTET